MPLKSGAKFHNGPGLRDVENARDYLTQRPQTKTTLVSAYDLKLPIELVFIEVFCHKPEIFGTYIVGSHDKDMCKVFSFPVRDKCWTFPAKSTDPE